MTPTRHGACSKCRRKAVYYSLITSKRFCTKHWPPDPVDNVPTRYKPGVGFVPDNSGPAWFAVETHNTPRQRSWKRIVAEMGRKGGIASAKALTPEQRKARAQKAVAARWEKRKER